VALVSGLGEVVGILSADDIYFCIVAPDMFGCASQFDVQRSVQDNGSIPTRLE
jgi:hypothetical protein